MNYLLTGTAIAALAIATPVWAQAPTTTPYTSGAPSTYSSGMPSAAGTSPYAQPQQQYAQPAPMPQAQQGAQQGVPQAPAATAGRMPEPAAEGATQPRARHHAMRGHHRRMHGATARAGRRGGQMNDNIADQLNREEANRVASGGTMPPGAQSQMPAEQGYPGQTPMQAPGPRPSGR